MWEIKRNSVVNSSNQRNDLIPGDIMVCSVKQCWLLLD